MKKIKQMRWLALLALAGLGGCASFPQYQVPQLTQMPDASHVAQKPTVVIDVKQYFGEDPGTEMRAAEDIVRPMVTKAILESGLVDPSAHALGDKTDLQIDVSIHDVGEMGAAMVSGFLCGFTLGIIPGEATDNYKVSVKISSSSTGKEVTTVVNEDAIHTWTGWIFLPMAGNTPANAVQDTLTNQVRTALKTAFEAGQLSIPAPATASAAP
jgi:hypothetical protein